ncbi:MAG: hypothetical protein ACLGSD_15995 [Acidobacteriota bacterium]
MLLATALIGLAGCHSQASTAQTASFTISQHGHNVGTASYQFSSVPGGYHATALVNVSMKGLNYSLSKDEQLDSASHLKSAVLSGTVNGSAVSIIAKPDASQFQLNISANGRASSSHLAFHPAAVLLPDFDPGALQTLLVLAVEQNNSNIWAIIPKEQGSIQAVTVATYPDEHGTFNGKPVTLHHLAATINNQPIDLFASERNHLMQAELPADGFALVRTGFVLTPPKKPIVPPGESTTPPQQQTPDAPQPQQQQPPQQY